MLEFAFANYYFVVLGLQAICAFHSYRKGTHQKWIWLIVFLPVIGSLIYIFSEMFTRNDLSNVQSGASAIFNPSGKIKRLKSNLQFRDTFNNRVALADAYLEAGQYDAAIELYEQSLVDNFSSHEHGNMQLIMTYYYKGRYQDVVNTAQKIYHLAQFARSKPHMMYAIALGYTNQPDAAEKEFRLMKGKFSNYECRYHFGLFLQRYQRSEEATQVFTEMVNEAAHLNSSERRPHREWLAKAKEALKTATVA